MTNKPKYAKLEGRKAGSTMIKLKLRWPLDSFETQVLVGILVVYFLMNVIPRYLPPPKLGPPIQIGVTR